MRLLRFLSWGVIAVLIILWLSRVTTALDHEEARWKSAGSPASQGDSAPPVPSAFPWSYAD